MKQLLNIFFVFFSGLSESRTEEERRQIVDEFFQNIETKIAENPDKHAMDYVHAFIVIEKRKVSKSMMVPECMIFYCKIMVFNSHIRA